MQKYGVEEGSGDGALLFGQRYSDSGHLADAFSLPQDDIQHSSIDGAVGRVDEGRSDKLGWLSEAVDTAFALLMAGWIPGQIVVDDGVKELLEVDPLGQAVRSDE